MVSNSHVIEEIRWLPCNGCGGEIGVPADWVDCQAKCPECGARVKIHGTILYRAAKEEQPKTSDRAEPGSRKYEQLYDHAVNENKPMVIFVGTPVRKVIGAVSIGLDDYYDNNAPRIIAGMPGKSASVLPVDASDEEIHDKLFKQGLATSPVTRFLLDESDERIHNSPFKQDVQPSDTAIVGPFSHASDARIQKAGEIVLFWGIACVALGWTVIVPIVAVILFLDLSDKTSKQKVSIPTQGWIGFALTATFGFVQTITVVRYMVMH